MRKQDLGEKIMEPKLSATAALSILGLLNAGERAAADWVK